jgi:hypothetical protein
MNRRKKEKQEETLRNAEILRTLGLTESPLSQLSSLVNTLNATQAPQIQQDQWGQEFGLRQDQFKQGMENDQLARMLQQQGLDLQRGGQEFDQGFKERSLGVEEGKIAFDQDYHNRALANMEQNQQTGDASQKLSLGLRLLEMMAPQNGLGGVINKEQIPQILELLGLGGVMNPGKKESGFKFDTSRALLPFGDDAVAEARAKIGR